MRKAITRGCAGCLAAVALTLVPAVFPAHANAGRQIVHPAFGPFTDWSSLTGRRSAGSARVRPNLGTWAGPADPGAIHFTVRRWKSPPRVINYMHVAGLAVCSTGRKVGFDFATSKREGVFHIFPNGKFGVSWGGQGEAQTIRGDIRYYASVYGRFTSRGRAKGTTSVTIWTTDPAVGTCKSRGSNGRQSVNWQATHH